MPLGVFSEDIAEFLFLILFRQIKDQRDQLTGSFLATEQKPGNDATGIGLEDNVLPNDIDWHFLFSSKMSY